MSPKRIYVGRYAVVINHEEQYSVIREGDPVPRGWKTTGREGTKTECLEFIEEVWTDMTKLDRERILTKF